jgi:CheY-like chemotaxis protein
MFSVEMMELLGRIEADRPDLLVLDFVIQDEGKGWQFLQLLKMDPDTRDIPVIVCTAAAKLVEELQTHLDNMKVAVVLKPFDIDHLLAQIDKQCAWENSDDLC